VPGYLARRRKIFLALGVSAARTWVMEASWRPPLARTITLSLLASSLYGRKVVVSNQMKLNLEDQTIIEIKG